ncbi:MAG: serine dehydratase subunit alpha family protein [Oscillospiraceae bacterium]|nr:serine dehydratase subunit alpha family protein [Oscillospiraceae bacterium]MBO5324372.1 serine dehydratase subunit alpha family protein [Oscillospiraceae bacterium]
MKKGDILYQQYLNILAEELKPAMGCTEPIALAYAAAKGRQILGCLPEKIDLLVSGNIIKNVKSVIVPNTGGLHGMAAAVCAGIVAGDADRELEVISQVPQQAHAAIRDYMNRVELNIQPASSDLVFDIDLTLEAQGQKARIRIVNNHTNIVLLEKNGEVLLQQPISDSSEEGLTDKSCLSVAGIVEFADCVDVEDIRPLVGRQIEYNMAIAEEGLSGHWGANIGTVMLHHQGGNLEKKASAYAAAGSDARMSGCEMPVIICSGSGNQGITASVPVVVFARGLEVSEDKLLRAVALSDLVTLHQKAGIGRLSAYCGAISAGCGAAAGIAYLQGGGEEAVAHILVNAIAILSGTICDGAKPSCAAKIAAAVDAGILGYHMYLDGQQFYGGDGIVTKGVDKTVRNVGILAREGMRETDRTILEIMLNND